MSTIQNAKIKLDALAAIKEKYLSVLSKELIAEYREYQGRDVEITKCINYISGTSNLTEEKNYQRLKSNGERYLLLTGATAKENSFVMLDNATKAPRFNDKEGLLVTRKGKAGTIRYLPKGRYTLNDDAYILYVKNDSPYEINLKWLSIQYKAEFLLYSSNSDNGTWNMTGFFDHTKIDIPSKKEQDAIVESYENLEKRIEMIMSIEKHYQNMLQKEIAS